MGLTIHYELTTTTGDEAHARKLVQQLRQAALDLPFQHVGEIVELRGDQCDYKQRADNDPYRWMLIQAGTFIALPVTPAERRQGITGSGAQAPGSPLTGPPVPVRSVRFTCGECSARTVKESF